MKNKNNLHKLILVALTGALLLAACSGGGAKKLTSTKDLYAETWALVAYGNGKEIEPIPEGLEIFIKFEEDGKLYGNAGCNNFFGSFTAADNGNLSIAEPLGSTLMFCEDVMDAEGEFLAAIQTASGFYFDKEGLLFITFEKTEYGYDRFVFEKQIDQTLAKTNWVLSVVSTPDGELIMLAGKEAFILFGEDGTASGNAGCNSFTTTFTADMESIQIEPGAMTAMMCEPEVMEVEEAFMAALHKVTGFSIDGNTLTLFDESHSHVLNFFSVVE